MADDIYAEMERKHKDTGRRQNPEPKKTRIAEN